mgnify:CR=1 FL=1
MTLGKSMIPLFVANMPHMVLAICGEVLLLIEYKGDELITYIHYVQVMTDVFDSARVLVTGGAGFIGSNICDALLERGSEVICLDNFLTGRRENIEHLLNESKFTLVEGDLRDLKTCRRAIAGCTHVCHQAALGSVPRSVEDPSTTNAINISGGLNVLVAAQEAGIKRFVFASTFAFGLLSLFIT